MLASAKLLEINPEIYTAWNYRKLALQHNLDGVTDAEIVKSLVDEELRTVSSPVLFFALRGHAILRQHPVWCRKSRRVGMS